MDELKRKARTKKPGPKKESIATKKRKAKEEIFCYRYALHNNGAKAAREAGYAEDSARVTATKILSKPYILEKIDEIKKENFKKLDISGERVLIEIAKLAFVNPQDFYNSDGTLKPVNEIEINEAACIQSLEIEEITFGRGKNKKSVGRNTKMKLYSKLNALKLLGDYNVLFDKGENDDLDESDPNDRFL